MGTIIKKGVVKREKGYLYYIDGAGNACKSKMASGKKTTKKVAAKKKAAPKKRVAKKTVRKTAKKK